MFAFDKSEIILEQRLLFDKNNAKVVSMNKLTKQVLGGVGAVAITAGLGLGLVKGANDAIDYECQSVEVTVESGDTLWDIVNEYCEGHTGHAVYQASELNGGSGLTIGQVVTLPNN